MKKKHQMCFLVVFLLGCTAANPPPLPPGTPTIESPGHNVQLTFEGHHGAEVTEIAFPLYIGKRWEISAGISGWIAEFFVTELRDGVATIEARDGKNSIGRCTYRRESKKADCVL